MSEPWTPGPWELDNHWITHGEDIVAIIDSTFSDADARLMSLAPEMAELLQATLDKLAAVHEASSGIFAMAANHGFVYDGPTYEAEANAIHDLLARAQGSAVSA